MIRRLWDVLAPVRPVRRDRGYRKLLRWAAVPVTDRRWGAPLCALAIGFGIFAGVAIGPGASGTLAGGLPTVIEIPAGEAEGNREEPEEVAEEAGGGFSGGGEESEPLSGEESSELPFVEAEPEEAFEEEPAGEEALPEGKGGEGPAPEPEDEAQVLSGIVVHLNPAAGSYTMVEAGGVMNAIHAGRLPTPKTKLQVPVRILANGTYAEAGTRKKTGAAKGAKLTGIVTFVDDDPAAPAYAVSKRGVSVLVRVRPDPTGAPVPLPQLGAYATAEVEVETPPAAVPPAEPGPAPEPGGCAPDPAVAPTVPKASGALWQRTLDADGAPFASSDFEGIVMAVCAGQLLLSGDDLREAGEDLLFTVPASIDTSKLLPGDSVAVTAAIEAGGALKLTGLAGDERTKGADDVSLTQGELVPQTQ